jgi:hypothetical protein
MAEPRINLNNYKSSGVYTVEIDASENVVLPLTTGRLIVGSSRVGPFNTVVLINDVRTLRAVFGEIDPKLEKAGSYFHRTIEVALREGPVFAMNVLPLDTDIVDPASNMDKAAFTTFNTESASNNNEATTTHEYPIVEFFNRQRLWFADYAKLNKSKNLALGDDYITTPGGFGITTAESNKVLSFANLGQFNMTVWVRKANVTGFDVTAKEWYSSVGGNDFPSFLHHDDFISDYFVEVIVVSGDWSNYLKLSNDPIYKQFFDASGLKSSKSADFFALREIKVINRTIGCLIPDFKDQSGITVSIDRLVNRAFPTTGLLCALDVEKLDLIDLTNDMFTDTDIYTHRVDIVGHGFDELTYSADDGGFDPSVYVGGVSGLTQNAIGTGYTTATGVATTTGGAGLGLTLDITDDGSGGIASISIAQAGTGYQIGDTITVTAGNTDATFTVASITYTTVAVNPKVLIDTLSYTRPADSTLIFELADSDSEAHFLAGNINAGQVAAGDVYGISGTVNYVVAMEGSKLYEAYMSGFLKTGDTSVDGISPARYLKIIDNLTVTGLKYIKINTYSDIALVTQVNTNTYAVSGTDYLKVILSSGDEFKHTFDLTDTAFFTNYTVSQPNSLTLELANPILSGNKATIDEYIKVNNYIKANVISDSRPRLLKIISVSSSTDILTGNVTYKVTTMAPTVDEVTGLDVAGNELKVYKGIPNFVSNLKGQNLKAFKIRNESLPDGTSARLESTDPMDHSILNYLFTDTLIPQALANGELVDFRYVVDSYAGTISSSSKYQLAKIAALNGQAMAILNAPSMQQFEKSVDPSFIDTTNKLVSTELIAAGGNLSLNPSFLYKFAEEDVKGVPLSSYSSYHFPNLIVRSGSKNISVPQAGYISNLYVRKFKNGTPFLIVAGGKRGALNDPEIVGLEYDLTDEDRDFLEPAGFNLTVKRRGFGIILFSNNTAYQRINSALNNAHVRDNLSTIERDIEKILFNFLFDFNDEITRLRVRTIVENYLNAVVNAKGISTYEVIFDSSNNTTDVISANAAIIDIRVDFPRGIQKFINRITITRVGGTLSSDATGFIPSF